MYINLSARWQIISKVYQNGVVLCTSNYVPVNRFVIDALPRALRIGHNRENFRQCNIGRKKMPNYRWSCTGLVGVLYLACTFTR